MSLNKAAIARLIPHAGSMVLLDSATNINANGLRCYSNSHLQSDNPLRTQQGLNASSGVEYAAQAAAIHIALSHAAGSGSGYLASCGNIQLTRGFLDDIAAELQVDIKQLAGSVDMGILKYEFLISARSKAINISAEIIRGELSIAIKHGESAND